jgi:hypothetical protein
VLSNRKPAHRKGQVQLIDASQWFKSLRKNLGKKNRELSPEDIARISRTFLEFKETPESKIFSNAAFGYWKVTVERPLRLHSQLTLRAIAWITPLPDLAQQHRRRNPVRPRLGDPRLQVRGVRIKLAGPQRPRSVAPCFLVAQVPPHGVPRQPHPSADLPNRLPLAGQYPNLHCLLLGQHVGGPKDRHPRPGGSLLPRRSGSVLRRR